MFIVLLAVGFGVGLIAARTTTFSNISEKAFDKYKELKDTVCSKKLD